MVNNSMKNNIYDCFQKFKLFFVVFPFFFFGCGESFDLKKTFNYTLLIIMRDKS